MKTCKVIWIFTWLFKNTVLKKGRFFFCWVYIASIDLLHLFLFLFYLSMLVVLFLFYCLHTLVSHMGLQKALHKYIWYGIFLLFTCPPVSHPAALCPLEGLYKISMATLHPAPPVGLQLSYWHMHVHVNFRQSQDGEQCRPQLVPLLHRKSSLYLTQSTVPTGMNTNYFRLKQKVKFFWFMVLLSFLLLCHIKCRISRYHHQPESLYCIVLLYLISFHHHPPWWGPWRQPHQRSVETTTTVLVCFY